MSKEARKEILPTISKQEDYGIASEIQFSPNILSVHKNLSELEDYALYHPSQLSQYPSFLLDTYNNVIDESGRGNTRFSFAISEHIVTAHIPYKEASYSCVMKQIKSITDATWYTQIRYKNSSSPIYLVLRSIPSFDWNTIIQHINGNYLVSGSTHRGGIFRDINVREYKNFAEYVIK